MIEIRELVKCALGLQARWQASKNLFCFIGGLAVQRWSEPRATRDVDATLYVGFGKEKAAVKEQLQFLQGRIDNVERFAIENRVILLQDLSGCPIDLSLGAMPFEREMIERSSVQSILPSLPGLRICSPSDLVILKTFAGRDRDWLDVRGTLVRSGQSLDWELIQRELTVLLELKEEPESLDRLLAMKASIPETS